MKLSNCEPKKNIHFHFSYSLSHTFSSVTIYVFRVVNLVAKKCLQILILVKSRIKRHQNLEFNDMIQIFIFFLIINSLWMNLKFLWYFESLSSRSEGRVVYLVSYIRTKNEKLRKKNERKKERKVFLKYSKSKSLSPRICFTVGIDVTRKVSEFLCFFF